MAVEDRDLVVAHFQQHLCGLVEDAVVVDVDVRVAVTGGSAAMDDERHVEVLQKTDALFAEVHVGQDHQINGAFFRKAAVDVHFFTLRGGDHDVVVKLGCLLRKTCQKLDEMRIEKHVHVSGEGDADHAGASGCQTARVDIGTIAIGLCCLRNPVSGGERHVRIPVQSSADCGL